MSGTDALISSLAGQLRPVRRLARPGTRIFVFAGCALALAAVELLLCRPVGLMDRLLVAPDAWLGMCGAVLTAFCAAIGCLLCGLPDRTPLWAALPLPALCLWIGASGVGCLRADLAGLPGLALGHSAGECLPFILGISCPLALVLGALQLGAGSLRPQLTALCSGLAIAASAASLLALIHPVDAGLTDLLVHGVAMGLVMLAVELAGWRLLARRSGAGADRGLLTARG